MSMEDPTTTVKTLFDLAGVSMSDKELERFARSYPTIRAQADALYRDEFNSESPMLTFNPLDTYASSDSVESDRGAQSSP